MKARKGLARKLVCGQNARKFAQLPMETIVADTPKDALERAINAVGTQTALASAIGGSVKTGHVYYWLNSGRVPAEHCPAIERATRAAAAATADPRLVVTCEELCPSVDWAVLREQVAPDTKAEAA